jgi:hypothetical protein
MRRSIVVLGALAAAAFAAPADAAPLRLTALPTTDDASEGRTFVAVQAAGGRRVRIVAFLRDPPPTDQAVRQLVVLRRGCGARRRVVARVPLSAGEVTDVKRRLPRRALRRSYSLAVVGTGTTTAAAGECGPWGRLAPNGAIVTPTDGERGLRIGIVGIWVPQGSPVVFVGGLLDLPPDTSWLVGASRRGCDQMFTATDDLWHWTHEVGGGGLLSFGVRRWAMRDTESIAVVAADATEPAPPRACGGLPRVA